MTRRDILGSDSGYRPGGGYRGLLTTRETVKALAFLLPLLGAMLLVQLLLGNRLATGLTRLVFAACLASMQLRVLRDPEFDGEPRTPAERRRLRLWAGIGLAIALGLAAFALYELLAPHPISAAE